MSYLVFCTFDLKNASREDYNNAYAELEKLGLKRVHKTSGGDAVIPTTSAMGEVNGGTASAVRDDIRSKIKQAFQARGLKSEIFVVVGGNWAWGAYTS